MKTKRFASTPVDDPKNDPPLSRYPRDPLCQTKTFGGRLLGHVYAPLDDFCIHCGVKMPSRKK